jgi:electron transfer flavoprotein beta subunit
LRLDRTGPGELNDTTDKNGIETALGLKESAGSSAGAEVVIVSMGPETTTESLRTALAMGADRGAGQRPRGRRLGSGATSRVLAAVLAAVPTSWCSVSRRATVVVRCCMEAAVADRLRIPFVSQVAELTVDGETLPGQCRR